MIYNYDEQRYENFDDFLEGDRQTAMLLLNELGLSIEEYAAYNWAADYIRVYPSVRDYAIYELTDGWYVEHNFNTDYNGAPNPMDWIDLESFGRRLVDTGDSGVCKLLPNGKVVTTDYGW